MKRIITLISFLLAAVMLLPVAASAYDPVDLPVAGVDVSSDKVIFALDYTNPDVAAMELFPIYAENYEELNENHTYGRAKAGPVSEFAELIGIPFPVTFADMLDTSIPSTATPEGKYIPGETDNTTFCIRIKNISVHEAIKILEANPYIKYAEYNYIYQPEVGTKESNTPVFSDVKDGAWYAKAVNSLNGLGIVNGDRGKFYPEMNISRCEFAMILSSLAGADTSAYEAAPFFDVEAGKWYSGAIAWAYAEGIVKGKTPTSFAPKDPITREEICAMTARLIWKYGLSEDGVPQRFTDDADIHGWANESVYTCRFLGIVNGYKDGSFRPGNLTKRCEAAQIVYQLVMKYGDRITGLSVEDALGKATITGIGGYDVGFPVATDGYAVRSNGSGPNIPPGAPKMREIRVISSKEAMSEYVNLTHTFFYYGSDNGPIPVYGLTDVLLSYNDEFFSKHDIAIVRLSTSSGSFGVRFVSVDYREGKYIFSANVYKPTEGGVTGDIGFWCLWAIVPKGTVNQNNITLEYNTVYY